MGRAGGDEMPLDSLRLDARTSGNFANGSSAIYAELLVGCAPGRPLRGYGLGQAVPMRGDSSAFTLRWQQRNGALSTWPRPRQLRGRGAVRLRLILCGDAKVYPTLHHTLYLHLYPRLHPHLHPLLHPLCIPFGFLTAALHVLLLPRSLPSSHALAESPRRAPWHHYQHLRWRDPTAGWMFSISPSGDARA